MGRWYPPKQKTEEREVSVNQVNILGRLGQDPELKHTPSGTSVCNFTMATTESYKDKTGQRQESTEWHKIVVWGKLAELCYQYLAKGKQAFVSGKLQTRSWDAKDGSKRYTTEIVAKEVQFLGEKGDSKKDQAAPQESAQFTSDDIPF